MNKVSILKPFMREVIIAGKSDPLKKVYTLMVEHDVSMIPIVEHKRQNIGLIRRKDILTRWMKGGVKPEIKELREKALPEVSMDEDLDAAMIKLHKASAVLVRNEDGIITHFISPRVIALALEDYSRRFRVLERVEGLIRKVLENISGEELTIALKRDQAPFNEKPGETDLTKLTFAEYHTAFSVFWDRLDLNALDFKSVLRLIEEVRKFRNSVMHFHIVNGSDELQSAESLERLLKG
jgi:hypothetical protein